MFFRNLSLMRLPPAWNMSAGQLEDFLILRQLAPCTGMSTISRGWVSPRGNDQLVYAFGRQLLIALGIEQKMLPAAVINKATRDRAEIIERQQGFKVGKKQMRDLKEQIFTELLPRAFTRQSVIRVWINPVNGLMVADSPSMGKLSEVAEFIRNMLGEFPCTLIETEAQPNIVMTNWLADSAAPAPFLLDDEAELRAPTEEKATVRYLRHELGLVDIRKHIVDGKLATKLGLTWNERISFVLNTDLQLKKVRFLDIDKNRAESQAENPDEQFDADFALMAGELSKLISDLGAALHFIKSE